MARIRTIKPEFFRDGKLQDIEADNPALRPMLVFAGLWTVADKNGVFEWDPRTLKLDILPFLAFDMGDSLSLLERFSLISRFECDGKRYGLVTNFCKHQRIQGKESISESKFPNPSQGIIGEAPEKQLGLQGKEVEGKGKGEVPQQNHPLNCAHRMIEILSLTSTFRLKETIAAAVVAEMGDSGLGPEDASQHITDCAIEQRKRGVKINKFWFEDTEWRNGNGSKRQASAVEQRVSGNREVLAELGREIIAERVGPNGDKRQGGAGTADRERISASAV